MDWQDTRDFSTRYSSSPAPMMRPSSVKTSWRNLPNRLELLFRTVVALPKASRSGFVCDASKMRIHRHTHVHTYIHTCTCVLMHTHMYIYTCMHMCINAHTHMYIHTQCTCTHTHTYTNTFNYTHTYHSTHPPTHTHTPTHSTICVIALTQPKRHTVLYFH